MMPSKHKLKVKRQKRRARAMARAATAAAPIAAQSAVSNGADILTALDRRFDELLAPRAPGEILVSALASKN